MSPGPGWSGAGGGTTGPKVASWRALYAGKLLIPVQGVATSSLHDDWAEPRGGGTREHHAIDIMAATRHARARRRRWSHREAVPEQARRHDDLRAVCGRRRGVLLCAPRSLRADVGRGAGGACGAGDRRGRLDRRRRCGQRRISTSRYTAWRPRERWWQGTEVDPYPVLARAVSSIDPRAVPRRRPGPRPAACS